MRGIEVDGTGAVEQTPDIAVVQISAEVAEASTARAMAEATASLAAMRAALIAGGVPESNLRTAQTNTWTDGGRVVVRLGLRARLDVAPSGDLIAAALAAGGQAARLDSTSFEVSDDAAAATQSRALAMADAYVKAEQLAALAGRTLGEVVSVREAGGDVAPRMMKSDGLAGAMRFDPGVAHSTSTLRVRFAWGTEPGA